MTARALLTDRKRDVLAGHAGGDAYRATVHSRVRKRLQALETDVEVLAVAEPELYEQLREIVLREN